VCLPELQTENVLIYEVYCRVFSSIENADPFKIMELLGVDDHLYCFDMINFVRNEVIKTRAMK
jgi:hypothetical protein